MMIIDKEEMIEITIKEQIEEEILRMLTKITEEIISEEMITKSEMALDQDQNSMLVHLQLSILLEANLQDLDLIQVITIDIKEIEMTIENLKEEGKLIYKDLTKI